MFNTPNKKLKLTLLLLVCLLSVLILLPAMAIGRPVVAPAAQAGTIVCTADYSDTPTFNLQATEGYISTPDGNSLYMWGYAPNPGSFQMPGPVLCVKDEAVVTVELTNNLPEPVSIVFPGQAGVAASMVSGTGISGLFTLEADTGETVSYTFTASEPGTYLYESGTEPYKQVHMGLYGALIVRPADGGSVVLDRAYDDSGSAFDPDREYLLVMHEIDSDLHQAVELGQTFDITQRHDHYWTINGRSMPDTLADNGVPWLPHQPYGALVRVEASPDYNAPAALIRYANAGSVNHPYHPHGNTMMVIGRDGHRLDIDMENFSQTVGAGQTYDMLFRWVDVEAWTPAPGNPIPVSGPALIPGLQNLTFKDDVTWYSGSPYLGETSTFPPGTTVYNECGEFYFPWHSHALNEFQNFDEGFGGLATLVRVDPPGGCP